MTDKETLKTIKSPLKKAICILAMKHWKWLKKRLEQTMTDKENQTPCDTCKVEPPALKFKCPTCEHNPDKEQIIIDGVNVSECFLYMNKFCIRTKCKCNAICDYASYVLRRQLKSKEQECENNKIAYQMELDIYNQECLNLQEELKAKEQECEELKEAIKIKTGKDYINEIQDITMKYECHQKSMGVCWWGKYGKETKCIGIRECHKRELEVIQNLEEIILQAIKDFSLEYGTPQYDRLLNGAKSLGIEVKDYE